MTTRKTKRLKSITQEDLDKMNPNNIELIEDFIMYCETVDKSPSTLVGYRSDLRIWMKWIHDNLKNKDFVDIQKRDVMRFQNWCIKRDMSPARIRGLKSAASSLSDYIVNLMDDLYPDFANIINEIESPVIVPVREKTILSDEQVDKLLEDLLDDGKTQQACMVAVLAGSGMRKSEVIQCNVDWFFGDNVVEYEGMYVTPEIRTKGAGVRGKQMKKYIIKDIVDHYLKLWIDERERLEINSDALFVIRRKGEWSRIKTSTIDSWMTLYSRLIGEVCYAHAFRHYASTWLRRNNVSVDVIRDFLGHNDSATTELYIDIDASENLAGMLDFMNKDK